MPRPLVRKLLKMKKQKIQSSRFLFKSAKRNLRSGLNIAVFASGNGSNFQVISNAIKKGRIKARLKVLICDNPRAFVLERARKAGVRAVIVCQEDYRNGAEFEEAVVRILKDEKVDLIVLAGFMRILSPEFIRRYRGKIINIHPSLLPAFKGAHAIRDAYDYGVKITGASVHFVDEKIDHGPIILQEAVKVSPRDTLKSLEKKIHAVEYKIYPQALKLFILGNLNG